MQLPVRISFLNIKTSTDAEATIREQAERLETLYDRLWACQVLVEGVRKPRCRGRAYRVRIELTLPDAELVAGGKASGQPARDDLPQAIEAAFETATRQLEHYADCRRRHRKPFGAQRDRVAQRPPLHSRAS